MRKGLVLAGIGFGGVALCALAGEAAAAWVAPLTIAAFVAVTMAMRSEPDEAGDGGGAGGAQPGGDGGGGDGDAGGDGGE
ncbi:hypothetical protein [Belnapia sp. F-4-1]|uniref:hypothetical protein n=1 Tax=Belnapia sp. F-4-1 TaxID=1545443 RepID=UPI0005B855C9|nr:hypothetical protein [Belnapia sp. F-4-1]